MIVSVHLADVGPRAAARALRRQPAPAEVAGLTYATTVTTAALGGGLLPAPRPGRVGMIAAWEHEEALDDFRPAIPAGRDLRRRLGSAAAAAAALGFWPEMPDLPRQPLPVDEEEPVVALTLGRRACAGPLPFLRSAAAAESEAVADPAMLASIGLARPPHLVSTFSIWRSNAAMMDYAYGRAGSHQAAVRSDRERPFHHASAFVRFRPTASGQLGRRDPLAAAQLPSGLNL